MIFTKITVAILISLAYIVSLIIIFFTKSNAINEETNIYKKLLIANLIGLMLHLLAESVCFYYDALPYILSYVVLKGILIYYFLFGLIMLTYLVVISKIEVKKTMLRIINALAIMVPLILLLIPLKVYRNVEEMSFYTYGLDVDFTYIVSGLVVVTMITILILKYKELSKKKMIPLLIFIIGGVISIIIQRNNPNIIVVDLIESVICCLMYFTIENPDIKMIQQLQVAREQADKANRAKTDFLSSMSHEIRTPLNAIVGFSDCIVEAKTLDEAQENAKDIMNASETLLEIVNGILDISKIEAGKIEIINSPYNAHELFEELAKLITPKMDEKALDFSYYIAPDLPQTLYGDHSNIKKVVTNFLSNASKYTEKGFVRYEVNCINTKDVCKLIITVEDSGRGIKKDNIDKMFTKFQRIDEDRNTTIEGTGLGLAITKQLVELMGGKIIVHTVYGEGSKFTVVLNQRIEEVKEEEHAHKVSTTLDLNNVRILIVDDNSLNIKVANKLLERYGANMITSIDNGFDCVEKIKSGEQYDVILLDDMMPKMSGVETLHKLKEIPGFRIPVVALTANAITGMREKYLEDGFDNYLAKPMEKAQVIEVLNEVLGRTATAEIPLKSIEEAKAEAKEEKESPEDVGKEEKNEVIPVEENIEEILKETNGALTSLNSIKTKEVLAVGEEIEMLDATQEIKPVVEEKPQAITQEVTNTRVELKRDLDSNNIYDRKYLELNGVDVEHGLELLGDMEMYNMTINDFAKDVANKWSKIIEYKRNNDLANYAIEVHSLKSDSKYLGFMKLADIAYQHELKSKEGDSDYVNNNFAELNNEYEKILEIVENYVSQNKVEE